VHCVLVVNLDANAILLPVARNIVFQQAVGKGHDKGLPNYCSRIAPIAHHRVRGWNDQSQPQQDAKELRPGKDLCCGQRKRQEVVQNETVHGHEHEDHSHDAAVRTHLAGTWPCA
jgi:hypothetical protein